MCTILNKPPTLFAVGQTHLHTYTHIFSQYSGISSHSFGRSYNCIYIGFIKIGECRMAGELIGLLHLLRLRDILRATIASKEIKDIWEKSLERGNCF